MVNEIHQPKSLGKTCLPLWVAIVVFISCFLAIAQPQTTRVHKVEISKLRGVVIDEAWALIPNATVLLQKKQQGTFRNLRSTQTNGNGEFMFTDVAMGDYQLVVAKDHFCRVRLQLTLSKDGWTGLKVRLPIAGYDRQIGYCDDELKIQPLEDTASRTK